MTNESANPLPADEREPLLLSAAELATTLRLSKRTLWRLLAAKILIPPIRVGGSVRWRISDVRRWIDDGCPEQ